MRARRLLTIGLVDIANVAKSSLDNDLEVSVVAD